MKNRLIIWDKDTEIFLKGIDRDDLILTEEEYKNFKFKDRKIDSIIILVELGLGWENTHLQDFYGLKIAQEIRKVKQIKCPIIFVSCFPPKLIHKLDKNQRKIIGAIGHEFLFIKDLNEKNIQERIKQVIELDERRYLYVLRNHSDAKSTVSTKYHDLKNKITAKHNEGKSNEEIINFINNELNNIKKSIIESGFFEAAKEIENYKIEKSDKDEENKNKINEFRQNTEDRLISRMKDDPEMEEKKIQQEDKFWEMLYVDDDEISKDILSSLNLKGIKKIHHAKTIVEAKKIIKQDELNKITVAIIDFKIYDRSEEAKELYGDELKEIQEQGFDFISWLNNQNRLNKIVALSSLSRKFIGEIFRKDNIEVKIYSKNNLTDEQSIKLFANDIEEYGDKIFEDLCSIPTSSYWEEKCKDWYIEICKSNDRDKIINEIDTKATEYIKNLNYIINSPESILTDKIGKTLEIELGSDINKPSFPKLNDVKNDVKKYIKGKKLFIKKLIARRAAIYLNANNYNQENIARIFNKTNNKIINNALALSLEDIPYFILPEEKRWLRRMVDENKIQYPLSNTTHYLKCFIINWLDNHKDLLGKINENKNYKKRFYSELDEEKKYPIINTIEDGKENFMLFKNYLNDQKELKKLLFNLEKIITLIESDQFCKNDGAGLREFLKKLNA